MKNSWQTVFDSFYTRFVLRDFFGKIVPGGILLFAIAVSATSPSSVAAYIASMSFWAWIATFGVSWLTAFAIQSFAENVRFIRYYPKVLFSVPNKCLATKLDTQSIPEEVNRAFTDNAFVLTGNAKVTITNVGREWQITDDEGKFILQKEGEKLNIYWPDAEAQKRFYNLRIRFDKQASPEEKQQVERLVVIKEACGNGWIALAISLVLVLLGAIPDSDNILSFAALSLSDLWFVVPFLVLAVAAVCYLRRMHFVHVQRQHEYMVQALKDHK